MKTKKREVIIKMIIYALICDIITTITTILIILLGK